MSRFVGPALKPLGDVKPTSELTKDQINFARFGGSAPRFVTQPQQSSQCKQDERVLLSVLAEGCPTPEYQWLEVLVTKQEVPCKNGTEVDLVVDTKVVQTKRYRVRASNSKGECRSEVAKVEVNPKTAISISPPDSSPGSGTGNQPTQPLETVRDQSRPIKQPKVWPDDLGPGRYTDQTKSKPPFRKALTWMVIAVVLLLVGLLGYQVLWQESYVESSKTPPSGWSLYGIGTRKGGPEQFTQGTNSPKFLRQLLNPPPPETLFTLKAQVGHFSESGSESFVFVGATNIITPPEGKTEPLTWETTLVDIPKDSMSRGIMIRAFADATNPKARFLFVGASGGTIVVSRREESGGKREDKNVPVAIIGLQTLSLRFVENPANTYQAEYKLKGGEWMPLPDTTNSFREETLLIGVAIASRLEEKNKEFDGRFKIKITKAATNVAPNVAPNVASKLSIFSYIKSWFAKNKTNSSPTAQNSDTQTKKPRDRTIHDPGTNVPPKGSQSGVANNGVPGAPPGGPPGTPKEPADESTAPHPTLPDGWVVTGIGSPLESEAKHFQAGEERMPKLPKIELSTGKSKGFGQEGDVCLFVQKEFDNHSSFSFLTTPVYPTNQALMPRGLSGIMLRTSLAPNAAFIFIGTGGPGMNQAIQVYWRKQDGGELKHEIIGTAVGLQTLQFSGKGSSELYPTFTRNPDLPNKRPQDCTLPKSPKLHAGWAIMSGGEAQKVKASFTFITPIHPPK